MAAMWRAQHVKLLRYDWWCHQYFQRLGIPVAPYYPIIGNVHEWLTKGNNNFGEECIKKYGKVVGIYKFRDPLLYVSDIDIVKKVLVTDFSKFPNHWDIPALGFPLNMAPTYMKGQRWKDIRAINTSTFTTSKLRQMVGIFSDCCDPLIKNLEKAHTHNKPLEAKK
ncbi:cytochrome P450 3A8-like [Acanthaster planci]|uniref:Cytochrome P450 3A8-like n=1 Tax=Acanthaster planci TaxID=133434 RepID=A0A8B7ZYB4_ACAPL|nr:cytochrome P450 3A8-like [Acanthaster planci]